MIATMMSVSVDGFFEAPGHDLGWQLVDDELHTHFNDWLGTASSFLDGRVTYELMAGFWPTADDDPAAPAPVRDFAGIWREMPKIVYSRSLDHAEWNTEVRREVDAGEVRALAARSDGAVVVGGANLLASFIELDLIDEYRIYVHPVVLGAGTPLFPASEIPTPLRLLETRAFGTGVVLLRYGRGREHPRG